jgi:hypothetical protein
LTATISVSPGTSVRTSSISLGNRRDRDVGDVSALAASIAADGLAHPLVLTTSHRLVSGRRRLEACTILGWTQIPAVTVTGIWEALELMEAELADPRHTEPLAKPLTVAEAMDFDLAMRELAWWPKKPPGPRGAGRQAPVDPKRRDRIAGLLGMNASTYARARILWAASRGYREHRGVRHPVPPRTQQHASELVAVITKRNEIRGAYETYKNGPPGPLTPARNGRKLLVRSQARAIEAALATMHGVITGLCGTGELDPAIPADTAARWETETTAAIRALTSFRKTIREQRADADRNES